MLRSSFNLGGQAKLLLLLALFAVECWWGACREYSCPTSRLAVDLLVPACIVSKSFLSVTIDANLLTDEQYITFLGSQKLRTLTRGLSPGHLRFGGTKADFMLFNPKRGSSIEDTYSKSQFGQATDSCQERSIPPDVEEYLQSRWAIEEPLILKEQSENVYRQMTITRGTLDMLYDFANCSELHLIFGLNALLRKTDLNWNSSNAEELLNYCASKQYNISWELGNEPNSFKKRAGILIDGSQLGEDFITLHELLQNYRSFKHAGLYGPDISQPNKQRKYLLKSFLEKAGKVIDSVTWHHYYVNGREASLRDFLSPEVLDTLILEIEFVLKIVKKTVPEKKVWLGETSSAYGGGAPKLSDTYAAGFMWLDKLGLSARLGIDVVFRQVLFGAGTYHLVDLKYEPLPDYWLSLLYKKLVGTKVLKVNIFNSEKEMNNNTLRAYAHCTNSNHPDYPKGAITMFALNLSNKTEKIKLLDPLFNKTVDQYLLQPVGKENLLSQTIQLNDQIMKMVDERTLPTLKGNTLPTKSVLELPAFSYAFYVIKDARAPACS